jgi:hypothetical protein
VLPRNLTYRVVNDHGEQGEYGIRWLDVEVVQPKSRRGNAGDEQGESDE